MKDRERERRRNKRGGINMQIHRIVQRACALAYHIKNDTGTVPS